VISRRGVLGLAVVAVAGLVGCSNSSSGDKGTPGAGGGKGEDPDTAVLAEAVADTRELIAHYDNAPASIRKKIVALRADHQAHLEALGATSTASATPTSAFGATTEPSAKPSGGPAALAELSTAEKTAADRRVDQCKRAKSGDLARLLASIGGCEAGHAKLLDAMS
jgi:hypothetical protein